MTNQANPKPSVYSEYNRKLFSFIHSCVTPFHTVSVLSDRLDSLGYTGLTEGEEWELLPGQNYYVTRNQSSLIAFRMPREMPACFMMTASHNDSPCFKIKEHAYEPSKEYTRFSVEKYGGMLSATWLDRPLAVAGRVVCKTQDGIASYLVDLGDDGTVSAMIPSVAPHQNRSANTNASYNPAVDMVPLAFIGDTCPDFYQVLGEKTDVDPQDILAHDLFLYNPQPGVTCGNMIACPRLDDLQSVFSCFCAFIKSDFEIAEDTCQVLCVFDNEEVGSRSPAGADSSLLDDTLTAIIESYGGSRRDLSRVIANSLMVSADNGHAVHPNHPEYADKNHTVRMNQGVVIKYNCSLKYASDGISVSIFKAICQNADVPVQAFANRADMEGGSTLGNISQTHISVPTVDIGLAQLAMHSAFETAGCMDTFYMVSALTEFYQSKILQSGNLGYRIESLYSRE